jgi:protein-tyrosine-phosphatase
MKKRFNQTMLKVLFVCYGNSCRSQMAEALANHLGNGRVRVWSAGSSPLGRIVPETLQVLEEKGIAVDRLWSKSLRDVPVDEMDVVVGMGCEVVCPVPVGFKGRVIEWNIPDPYGRGLEAFRGVRELVARQVAALLEDLARSKEADGKDSQAQG